MLLCKLHKVKPTENLLVYFVLAAVVQLETVGDAYTCASGVPIRNPNHAEELADMALDIRVAVSEFKVCKNLMPELLWRLAYNNISHWCW